MKKISNTLSNLIWLYKAYWCYAKAYVMMSLILWIVGIPVFRYLLVIFPQTVVDAIEKGWSFYETAVMIVIFQLVLLLIPLFEDFHRMLFKDPGEAMTEIGIRKEIYKQAAGTDYQYMDDPEYYNKYTWTAQQQPAQCAAAFQLMNQSISAVLVIGTMIRLISGFSPWIVILTICNMALRTVGYLKFYKIQLQRDEEIVTYDRKLDYFHRIFYQREYAADLRSTSLRTFLQRDYDQEASEKLKRIRQYAKGLIGWDIFSNVIYRVFMMVIIICIVYEIYSGSITEAASYITIMLAVERLDDSMMEFFNLIRDGGKISMYTEDIRAFYKLESVIENQEGGLSAPSGSYSVDVKDVHFHYHNSDAILKGLNLQIRPGEKIAIVGENGAGKSTFVKLLLRFYDPQRGKILLQGQSLDHYNLKELRKQIGVVFQNTNIYALPLCENMNLCQENTHESIQQALESVGLQRLRSKLNDTMTREFSENGIMLSGGEMQKLALGRVLAGNFGLLILDEPSSALDPIAESEMSQLILNSSRRTTTIMIAHRLSNVRNMDRIYVIHDGRAVESGTHDALMALKGRYYRMFTKQAEKYIGIEDSYK